MIFTSGLSRPTSSQSSRYMASSGDSFSLMPPCGNCQASWPERRAQSTWPAVLQRMMPTLGRKPSASITAWSQKIAEVGPPSHCFINTLEAMAGARDMADFSSANRYYAGLPACPEPAMTLAIFDLDNTLLAGDSDHAWGEFLISRGLVDADSYRA